MSDETKIPPYFYFNTSYCAFFDVLTNEQAGAVIKYICDYVRQEDAPADQLDDAAVKMAVCMMKQDIDRAFNKYHAQCENGKKGGAPKGNKNAAKAKNTTHSKELWTFPIDKINDTISYEILDVIYFEAKKTNFNIDEYLTSSQLSEIVACYSILQYIDICDSFEIFGFEEYSSLKEFCLNESASTTCRELKKVTEEYYNDSDKICERGFSSIFAEFKDRASQILKFPHDQIKKFSDKCEAVLDDCFSDEELAQKFTEEEITEIKALIQEKNNPKTTQNNQ